MEGRTIPTLVEMAKGAEMLVVGSSAARSLRRDAAGLGNGALRRAREVSGRGSATRRERGLGDIDNQGPLSVGPSGNAGTQGTFPISVVNRDRPNRQPSGPLAPDGRTLGALTMVARALWHRPGDQKQNRKGKMQR